MTKVAAGKENGLDPDQDRHSVCPDLGPNYLQMLSADDNWPLSKERVGEVWHLLDIQVRPPGYKTFFMLNSTEP